MKYKILILKIINDNPSVGIQKFDRLFYESAERFVHWPTIMEQLIKEKLVEKQILKITPKGIEYLKKI